LSKPTTIAIDGPAASGKSTIGFSLAKRLDYVYLDTGVMYRAVTWAALEQGLDITDEAAITALTEGLEINVRPSDGSDGRQYTVLIDSQDITQQIRQPAVEQRVSLVSAYPGVRKALVAQQRRISQQARVVMVGRDIGTVVLPDADLKIYLDARVRVRAMRRYKELIRRGQQISFEQVLADMERRDSIDSEREVSPLEPAEDAVIIDTSDMSVDQVLDVVEELVCSQGG
jgi:cytidylate kinase